MAAVTVRLRTAANGEPRAKAAPPFWPGYVAMLEGTLRRRQRLYGGHLAKITNLRFLELPAAGTCMAGVSTEGGERKLHFVSTQKPPHYFKVTT